MSRATNSAFAALRSTLRAPAPSTTRTFTSSRLSLAADKPKSSVPVALIAKIRAQRPGTPLSLARSALQAAENDLDGALAWIAQQAQESGAKKQEKLAGRTAEQGLVAVAVLADGTGGTGVRASLVEMRCETDFVARTDEFRQLAEGVARSLAFFAEPSASNGLVQLDVKHDTTLDMPVVPSPQHITPDTTPSAPETVRSSLASIVSRLGENIKLHRAASISLEPSLPSSPVPTFLASSYLHASKTPAEAAKDGVQSGTLGGLVIAQLSKGGNVEKPEVKSVLRALARQVVAVPTASIAASSAAPPPQQGEPSTALYDQQLITMAPSPKFEFDAGSNVREVLNKWSQVRGVKGDGLQVTELARWELGAETPSE
ncbi:uncharacterized protein JCM15063_003148 [Sporobolomyces koalae]|uniref:uncharacterized protein n=1 Tax=Sporobolomyces koalae TaxID=500713 RepID=UPI00317FF8E7